MISADELINIKPEILKEHTANLSNLLQNIGNEVANLRIINSTAKQFWNQGIGTDVESYGKELEDNIKIIEEKIIPSLKKYIQTMNTLADAVRDTANTSVGSSKSISASIK